MNISTGYDNLLISPGRPHSGGVRPSSVKSGPRATATQEASSSKGICCAKVGNPTVVPSRMMDKEVRGGEILMDLVPTPFGGRYAHHTHISG